MATPSAPVLSLTPTLQVFSGGHDEEVLVFLNRLDRLLAICPNVTPEQKLFYLENQCTKGPLSLIQRELQYLADHPLPDGQVRTAKDIYEHAKDCLTQSYTAAVDEEHYKTELQTRVKKESETLNDYVQVILELCREAKVRSLSSKLKYLHAGLPLHLSTALRSTDYTDVPTFISVVQKLEATQRATFRAHALHTGAYPHPYPFPFPPYPLPAPPAAPLPAAPLSSAPLPAAFAPVAASPAVPAVPSARSLPSTDASDGSNKTERLLNSLISKLQELLSLPNQPTVSFVGNDIYPLDDPDARPDYDEEHSERSPRIICNFCRGFHYDAECCLQDSFNSKN